MLNEAVATLPQTVRSCGNAENRIGEFFSFEGNSSSDLQVEILSGGIQYCSSDYYEESNNQDHYSIEYIMSGTGTIRLRDNLFQMCSGTVFFHGPNIPCQMENTSSGELKKCYINFRVKDGKNWDWDSFLKSHNPTILGSHHWLAQTLMQIVECGTSKNAFSANTCSMLLKYMISRIIEEGNQVPVIMGLARDSFEKAKCYIEENFQSITRISEVAKACHMSQPHISRLFKRFSEQSPSDYLMSLKMKCAMDMLGQGTLLVKEIAGEVGFLDPYYFSTRFKQIYGVSPSQYLSLKNQNTVTKREVF